MPDAPSTFGSGTFGGGTLGAPPNAPTAKKPATLTHACELQLASGEYQRYGPDERDVGNIPVSLECDTELPGGYGPASIILPRPDWMQAEDAKLFASTRFYFAETNQTFHEGRITGTPQVGVSQIELQIEGWSKHAEDDKTARFLGIDRDLSQWQGMGVSRQLGLLAVPRILGGDATVSPDPTNGAPALTNTLQGPWDGAINNEGWYSAKGLSIAAVDYAWKVGSTIDTTSGNWSWAILLSNDDIPSLVDDTGGLRAAGPGSGTITATATRNWAAVRLINFFANSSQAAFPLYWTLLAAIGSHGLPLYGSVAAPNTGRWLLASDILPYLIGKFAPLWNYSTGVGGSIPPTSFPITHTVYLDNTTLAAMLGDYVLLSGTSDYPLDWGVYDNREFFMKAPGSYGTDWRARRDQATEPTSQGADAADRLNGVKVIYDDGTGTKFSVGPPGSGADLEDARLQDSSLSNPANQDGARHWQSFDAGIMTQPNAITIGQLLLAAANRREWRGDIAFKDVIYDSGGVEHQAALVKSGDRVVVEDDADTSERRIVNTRYTSIDRVLTASVGAPPNMLDVLLAQTRLVTAVAIGSG